MDDGTSLPTFDRGRISQADRIQRLLIGGALMALTVSGLIHRIEWRGVVALTLQAELLLTGLVGWCPIYWTCRLNSPTQRKEE